MLRVRQSRPPYLLYAGVALLGVLVRAVFLMLAGDLDAFADEVNYIYLALSWNRFSIYPDCVRYLWPPGYPFFLAVLLRFFQADAIFIAKACQVVLSGIIGFVTMLLAERVFDRRAAKVAGGLWCAYLPLIAFTHYTWPETLFLVFFLPGLYLLLTWWTLAEGDSGAGRLLAAGLLLGVALLIKEVILYLVVALVLLVVWRHRRGSWARGVGHASLLLLSTAAVVVPWTLRNYEVYGRLAPVGASLGENCYQGILRPYAAFDYPQVDYAQLYGREHARYRWFVERPPGITAQRAGAPNVVDRSAADVRQAQRVMVEHPKWFARGRLKRLANWLAPTSFFVRHYALRRYDGTLNVPSVRRTLLVVSIVESAAVIVLALAGATLALRKPAARTVLGWTLLYFMATALLVGMSRHRGAVAPLLIVLAAGFLSGSGRPWLRRKRPVVLLAIGGLIVGSLWWINYPEVALFLERAW
ncbi:MAG: glycosyltransferase family 39 protein [Planctomycetes bacterium]|nr:glycosyltransferase family 39 protein [Planctomycetota bacterium]